MIWSHFAENKIYDSILTNALRQTYLYQWFDHNLQKLKVSFHSNQPSQADMLVQVIWTHLAGTYWIILFWPMILGTHTCTSNLITNGRNLMYHSILNNAFRPSYLYKWIDFTWQETNVSFHSYIGWHTCTIDSITLGRNLMYHSILTKAPRQIYMHKYYHTW